MTFKRIDYFTCGHKYLFAPENHGDIKVNKCPECGNGDYNYSMLEEIGRPEPEPRVSSEWARSVNPTVGVGVDFGTAGSGGASTGYVQFDIGSVGATYNGTLFSGTIDDARLYNTPMPSDWASVPPGDEPEAEETNPEGREHPHENGRTTWGLYLGGHHNLREYLACDICQGGTHDEPTEPDVGYYTH